MIKYLGKEPKIHIHNNALNKIFLYTKSATNSIAWMLEIHKKDESNFYINDVFLPKQSAGYSTVDIDQDSLSYLLDFGDDQNLFSYNGIGLSKVNASPNIVEYEYKYFEKYLGICSWYIAMQTNKNKEISISFINNLHRIAFEKMSYEIFYDTPDNLEDDVKIEIADKVKSTYYTNNSYSNSATTNTRLGAIKNDTPSKLVTSSPELADIT